MFCHFPGVHANNHVVNVCDLKYVDYKNLPVLINKHEDKSCCILMARWWPSREDCLVLW